MPHRVKTWLHQENAQMINNRQSKKIINLIYRRHKKSTCNLVRTTSRNKRYQRLPDYPSWMEGNRTFSVYKYPASLWAKQGIDALLRFYTVRNPSHCTIFQCIIAADGPKTLRSATLKAHCDICVCVWACVRACVQLVYIFYSSAVSEISIHSLAIREPGSWRSQRCGFNRNIIPEGTLWIILFFFQVS